MKPSALAATLLPIPGVLYILCALGPARGGDWTPARLAGLALICPSVLLLTLARVQLGNAFSVAPEATVLVTRGLYARIRNPVYTFGLVLFAGILLYAGYERYLLLLVPVAVMQVVRAKKEATALEAKFGDAYRAYRARTWL